MKFLTQLFISIVLCSIITIFYGLADAKNLPKDTMWAKCIKKDTILDCKLVGHKVVINGKDINVTRLGVIELHNVVYVLLKDNK